MADKNDYKGVILCVMYIAVGKAESLLEQITGLRADNNPASSCLGVGYLKGVA